jgi:hypothetical protein
MEAAPTWERRGGGRWAAKRWHEAAKNGSGARPGGGGLAFSRRKEKSSWASAGLKGGCGVAGLRRPIGQLGRCEAFRPREEGGCSGPRWAKRSGGPCTLENQPGQKNEKEKKNKGWAARDVLGRMETGSGWEKRKEKGECNGWAEWIFGPKGFWAKNEERRNELQNLIILNLDSRN